MKILHFSDIHIGVENYGRIDPDTGLSTRLLDFLSTFDELVEFALEHEVDAVLFAGDAYKSRDPSQTHQREFAKRIARLAIKGIPVLLVVGNHDIPTTSGRATALEIFPTLNMNGVTVIDRISTTTIHTKSGPIQIIGLPWIRRSSFLAREETRTMSLDDINQMVEERLIALLNNEIEKLNTSIPAILVGHITVRGAKVGSERSMMLGRDHSINISDLANHKLDYIALGHIHKHQTLNENPKVTYSGSLQRVDFSEETEEKGFCVIDIVPEENQGSRISGFEHHLVNARPFLTIDVNIEDSEEDPTEQVVKAINRKYIDNSVVRIRIEIPEELESRLREVSIREALAKAHYIAGIQRTVIRQNRTRISPEASHGLSIKEALTLYLDTRQTEQKRKEVLLYHADSLLREESEAE